MKFFMQCTKAANTTMQALGQIKRTFKYITPQSSNSIQSIQQASFGELTLFEPLVKESLAN